LLPASLSVPEAPYGAKANQVFFVSIAARASAMLSRIRFMMMVVASLLDFCTNSVMSLVFLATASNVRRASSVCLPQSLAANPPV